jgi:unsaturated rhamnogalacturonyl hydrolase
VKRLSLALTACCLSGLLSAQSRPGPEEVLRKVADNVIQHTSFRLVNSRTGEKYTSAKGLALSNDIKAESPYNKWEYPNGVLTIGMMQLSKVLQDKKYAEYSLHNFEFIFNNLDYFQRLYTDSGRSEWSTFFSMQNLDACGAMAAGLSDVNALAGNKGYRQYLDRAANYISTRQLRLPDGTLSRPMPHNMTLWADDLYMSVPFLARMGKMTGDTKYFEDAIRQVENFNRYLYDSSTGLYFHCFYNTVNRNGVARWGRCNGWIAMAQAELIDALPASHPKRNELIALLLRQIIGFSRYQDLSGLWHQVLDRPDSYLETSATAMFTYAVAKAVNEGWIDRTYMSIARDGWEGLTAKINDEGQVEEVCIGTSIADNIRFYLTRPRKLNDTHALGAVLLAGSEMIKANALK